MTNEGAYYIVIPGYIRADKKLSPYAKLLYGEIAVKSNIKGYCFATNQHFSEIFDINIRSIQRYIKELEDSNYIFIEVDKGGNGTDRRMFITEAAAKEATNLSRKGATNLSGGYDSGVVPPYDSGVVHNNKNRDKEEDNNNTSFTLPNSKVKGPRDKNGSSKKADASKKNEKVRAKDAPPSETYKGFIAIYDKWFKEINDGLPPDYSGGNGNAAKKIIAYMRNIAKQTAEDRKLILSADDLENKLLECWQHVLNSWLRIEPFLQDKTQLREIGSQIQNIVKQVKNGHSKNKHKKPTGGEVSTESLARSIASYYSGAGRSAGPDGQGQQ